MSIDFTVAIPTLNGADRVPLVLDKLRSQITPAQLNWEMLVVDNNSSDGTAQVVQEYQSSWGGSVPLRYCFESQQGLAFARQRAIDEAQGEFVGFLDDDNLPTSDWVAKAYEFGIAHPQAGVYGSQIKANFLGEPPADINQIKNFLAIRNYSDTPQRYQPETLRLPAGAGLVVRRQAWLDHVPRQFICVARSGDDYEISLHLHKAGWEIWHNPAMILYHHIPAHRLEPTYLLPLARLYGETTCDLRMLLVNPGQRPLVLARHLLGSLRRFLHHWHRHRGQLQDDLGAACELEFLRGQVISPFVYLKRQLSLGQR
jgi:glycosyltransferase involved in cell wall biosynthesis